MDVLYVRPELPVEGADVDVAAFEDEAAVATAALEVEAVVGAT